MAKIVVGLHHDRPAGNYGRALNTSLQDMEAKILRCHARMAAVDNKHNGLFNNIYVATEYFFSGSNAGARSPLTVAQKNQIENTLLAVSRKAPRTLIFSGSIFYAEPANTPNTRGRMTTALISSEFELKKQYWQITRPPGPMNFKTVADLDVHSDLVAIQNTLNQADRVAAIAIHNKLYPWATGGGTVVPGLIVAARGVSDAAVNNTVVRRAHNQANVFLNGEKVMEYHKHSDFQETQGAPTSQMIFIPSLSVPTFEVDGYKFGMEICFDHANASLKNHNVDDLHFQVILSDFVNTKDSHTAMRRGGYLLHASTNSNETQIRQRNANGMGFVDKPLTPTPVYGHNALSLSELVMPQR